MTFEELQLANLDRDEEAFDGMMAEKDLCFFGTAIAGEVGEACNIIKKIERGDFTDSELTQAFVDLGKELADVVTYADIIASKIGRNLGTCVRDKFNEVSDRVGSDVRFG